MKQGAWIKGVGLITTFAVIMGLGMVMLKGTEQVPLNRVETKEPQMTAKPQKNYQTSNSQVDWNAKTLQSIQNKKMFIKILKDCDLYGKPSIEIKGCLENSVSEETSNIIAEEASKEMAMDYSTTNVQVQGVDEADTMKNDGRYIYLIDEEGSRLSIVDTQGELKQISNIPCKDKDESFQSMILEDETLIVFGRAQKVYKNLIGIERFDKLFTTVSIYDIKDRKTPKLIRETQVEGEKESIRKIGDKIYIVTSQCRDFINEWRATDKELFSYYSDTAINDGEFQQIDFENMYYEPWSQCHYNTVLAIVPLKQEEKVDVQFILGNSVTSYMNQKALYLAESIYDSNSSHKRDDQEMFCQTFAKTYISKYVLDANRLTYYTTGKVDGRMLNQFSMDEYKGNLRVATTTDEDESGIYILDDKLDKIGEITHLAPGERIYSARFEGDKGYLVTYKEMDPLFVFDLSHPKQPKALGKLKIPGFSQYLHPIGNHLVVGIGRATSDVIAEDEEGNKSVIGVRTSGLKFSLFDVKDVEKPIEVNHIILGNEESYSEALNNHNAVMVNEKKSMMGVPLHLEFDEEPDFDGAYIFAVEDGKLVGKSKLGRMTFADRQYEDSSRICYIGDKLYYIYGDAVNMYSMDNFERISTIHLE